MPPPRAFDEVAELRHRVFHAAPPAAAAAAQRALRQGIADPHREVQWLLGVAWGATGRYREALGALAAVGDGVTFSSLALSTGASLYRQVERHEQARELDLRAQRLARTAIDRFDAELGLAADAVGLGDRDVARAHWLKAAAVMGDHWRPQVRHGWVEAEIALMEGDPASALRAAQESVRWSAAALAPRHHAKSQLFAGVSAAVMGDRALAHRELSQALAKAEHLGAWPLAWPAAVVLRSQVSSEHSVALTRKAAVIVTALASAMPEDWAVTWRQLRMQQLRQAA